MELRVTRESGDEILGTEIEKAPPDHALIRLAGELDASNVSRLYEELAELAHEGRRHTVLDLTELTFVDSTGLSAIIAAHKRAEKAGAELILFSPQPQVRNLFTIAGIDRYLHIRPSNEADDAGDAAGVEDRGDGAATA